MTSQPRHDAHVPSGAVSQAAQPQVVYQTSSEVPVQYEGMRKTMLGLGIAEVVLGSLSIIFAIVVKAIKHREADKYFSGKSGAEYQLAKVAFQVFSRMRSMQGIWGGSLIVTTGVLGICAKYKPTTCLFVANMIMALVTTKLLVAVVGLSIAAAIVSWFSVALVVLNGMIALCTFVSFILTFIHAIQCCCSICCHGVTRMEQRNTRQQQARINRNAQV